MWSRMLRPQVDGQEVMPSDSQIAAVRARLAAAAPAAAAAASAPSRSGRSKSKSSSSGEAAGSSSSGEAAGSSGGSSSTKRRRDEPTESAKMAFEDINFCPKCGHDLSAVGPLRTERHITRCGKL